MVHYLALARTRFVHHAVRPPACCPPANLTTRPQLFFRSRPSPVHHGPPRTRHASVRPVARSPTTTSRYTTGVRHHHHWVVYTDAVCSIAHRSSSFIGRPRTTFARLHLQFRLSAYDHHINVNTTPYCRFRRTSSERRHNAHWFITCHVTTAVIMLLSSASSPPPLDNCHLPQQRPPYIATTNNQQINNEAQ